MKWLIVGLGNPGTEYATTRHNAGRIVLEMFRDLECFPDWEFKKTYNAFYSAKETVDANVILLMPETFMNDSGKSLAKLVKSKKQSEHLIVIYDDMDLPLGTWKISWNKNSGGHNGVESISTVLKTKEFIRIRVGISPVGDDHMMRKPAGDEAIIKFVLGKFMQKEIKTIEQISKEISSAILVLVTEGLGTAMNRYN